VVVSAASARGDGSRDQVVVHRSPRDLERGLLVAVREKLRAGGVRALVAGVVHTALRGLENTAWRGVETLRGFDTRGKIPGSELGDDCGRGYEPTRPWMLRTVVTPLPIDRSAFTFVDLGSGKGRVLLLAAGLGFRSLLGVESNRSLAEISRHNVERYQRRKRALRFEIRVGDAGSIELPNHPLVIFMFNPFGKEVMARVVAAIEASYLDQPRPIYVTYWNPKEIETIDHSPTLEPFLVNRYYCIYETPAASASATDSGPR
jgi:hypothetical protein